MVSNESEKRIVWNAAQLAAHTIGAHNLRLWTGTKEHIRECSMKKTKICMHLDCLSTRAGSKQYQMRGIFCNALACAHGMSTTLFNPSWIGLVELMKPSECKFRGDCVINWIHQIPWIPWQTLGLDLNIKAMLRSILAKVVCNLVSGSSDTKT